MSITATHGTVYRAISEDGTVLYVGMTTRLEGRLKDHARKSEWWPLHDRIEHDEPLPLDAAFASEADQIALLRPRFNRISGWVDRFGPDTTSEHQAAQWKRAYEAGRTIEEIALDASVSTKTVRKHLVALGTEMRRAGQRAGIQHLNRAKSAQSGSHGAVVHVAFGGARGTHRRRGAKRAA